MLSWSINLFRIFGIQLAVHASFVLLLAYAGWQGWVNDGGGWQGMLENILLIILFFICVVLHELGHSLTARRYGVKVPRILLMPIGGMAEFDRIPRQPSAEFIITINGPLVNFAIALILWSLVGLPAGPLWNPQLSDGFLTRQAQILLCWNTVMGCFNLLPVFHMDGGRIFRSILATRLPYLRATFWAARVGQIMAILLVVAAIYNKWWMMAVLFSFIYTVAGAEYKNLRRREEESAYWEEMAKRIVIPVQRPDHDDPSVPPRLIIPGPN